MLLLVANLAWGAWFAIGYDASGVLSVLLMNVTDVTTDRGDSPRATLTYAEDGLAASVYFLQDIDASSEDRMLSWVRWYGGSVNRIEEIVPAHSLRFYDRHFRGATDDPTDRCLIHTVGWPVRSLWCASTRQSQQWRVAGFTGIQLPGGSRERSSHYLSEFGRVMPLRPLWRGQLVWAGCCLLFVLGVRIIWRLREWLRAAKGCCIACGYDLRLNETGVCPECGTVFERATSFEP